ncbi:MAG TPA: hypothetical protein VK658_09840 [Chryseolinea sp.]|nr:hypothetical protein [Chryseolinea sp.]
MKTTVKLIAFLIAIGLATACSTRNENSAQTAGESEKDSVESVAPAADGMPTDGGTPSNPGSPPDSAAQAIDPDSTLRR